MHSFSIVIYIIYHIYRSFPSKLYTYVQPETKYFVHVKSIIMFTNFVSSFCLNFTSHRFKVFNLYKYFFASHRLEVSICTSIFHTTNVSFPVLRLQSKTHDYVFYN